MNLLYSLIADVRNRILETRAIIKLVGKEKYTEVQGLFKIDQEMEKLETILKDYEEKISKWGWGE